MSYERIKTIFQLATQEVAIEILKDLQDKAENNNNLKEAGKIQQLLNKIDNGNHGYQDKLVKHMWIHLETELETILESIV